MDNNTIIGYNILAKRAIETESGVNIDDALNRITAYNIVGYTEDGTPAVPNGISTKILYLATNRPGMPDAKYTGWIFTTLSGWVKVFDELTGDDVNSWKSWSEEHGSSSTKDGSVYIGPDNSIGRSDTYVLGKNNTVKNERTSDAIYEDTDIVILGTDNSSIDGANVYQLGRENRVIGNNLGSRESYPKQVAVNIGIDNTITSYSNNRESVGEGVNIGKSNSSSMFGIAIGQNNQSYGASVVIGENLNANGTYSATIIGHEKAEYQVDSIENAPSLNGIPLGKYELLDFRNYGREVKHAWFDNDGHPVETKRYYAVVNADTDEVKFEDNDNTNGYYISSNGNRYGYIDDTGLLISTNDPAPSGKVKNTYTAYYTTRHSYSERVYFWGTTYYNKYIRTDQFVPDIWRTYKLSEVSQYFIDSDLGNVYISDTEAFSKNYNRDEFVLYKVRVTGKEVDGTFIPWFNDNFDLNECTTRDFYPSELNYQSSIYLDTNKIVLNEENCGSRFTDVSYGASLFGSLAKVEYGGSAYTQTHNHYIALKYPSLPGYQTFYSTRYTWNGSSYSSQSYSFCSVDNEVQLTPSGILKIIQPYVHNGAVGIAALTGEYNTAIDDYSNFSNSLEVSYGSLGIGDRMYIDTGSIGIGRNQFGIGSGTIAIGMDNLWGTNKYNNSYGATLIGKYNKSSISGGPLSGSTVVGNNNYFDNYASGAVLLGNYNRFDSYDGGNGSVLIGVNSSIKGSGSIAIGTGYNGGGGAHARYAAIAISYKGAIASNNATALGGNGCAAFYGAAAIGWAGCTAITGGIALGWNGVCAEYGSVAIGHDGSCTLMGGVSIGWNGVCSEYGAVTLGFDGAFANGGAFAIGHNGVNGLYGGIAIGLNNSFAEDGAISIGTNTVKGKSGSIALGLCGTYAVGGSVAIGHKSHAFYGGLSVVNNTTGGPDYSFQENSNLPFVYYRESEESYCYPEFRVLKGTPTKVDYIYGSDNTVVDIIENPNGRYSAYKTATGKYYENLSSIPYTEWSRVWIRATEDEDGTIHPFYGMKINILEAQERVDNWVEVPICRSGALQPGECSIQNHPGLDELEMDCAANGGNTFGAKAFSKYGSVSIGTDYAAGGFSCSNRAITIDGYEAREFDRYSGCINNGKFYPWNVYQAYSAYNSVAIGSSVIAENASIAMGIAPVKANYGSLALGYGASADYEDLVYGTAESGSLLICGRDNTDGIVKRGLSRYKSIAIGTGVVATSDSIAIGDRTEADDISSAIGFCSTADNASIAYGDSNHSKLNAISIGSRNISSGWSIALGVNNTSYDGLGGHATMIGQFNTSTSNQEVIHKEFQGEFIPGVPYEPTEIELSQVSQYRTAVHNALATGLTSSELAIFDSYYSQYEDWGLGRTDNYPSVSQEMIDISKQLKTNPPYNLTTEDKATVLAIFNAPFDDWEAMKALYLSLFEIASKYDSSVTNAFLQELRNTNSEEEFVSCINNHPEMNVPLMNLQQSAFYEGEPIQGKLTQEQYNIYETNNYSLSTLLSQIRRKIDNSSEGHYEIIDEDVVCNSFLVGNNNKSNHYNSILIGALNESKTPLIQPDPTYHTTDDDGFMIAIGYRNVVGRNYDMAFGYRSKAIGGENVALQHSEAEGYRNFAAFDSKVRGTANVLLGESTLLIPWDGGTSGSLNKLNAATHNLMFNSLSEHTTKPTGGYMQNVLLDVDLVTNTKSVTENFIYGGAGHENNTKVELTAGYAVTGNVILGSQHGSKPLQITCENAIIDNIISHPSSIVANASYAFHRNILIGQKHNGNGGEPPPIMNITGAETIIKNMVIHGSIIGKAHTFINNIVLNDSQLESTYDQGDGGCVINNILLNNAKLVNTDIETWWSGSYRQPCTDNIIVGAEVSDSINSVIISDRYTSNSAQISDALRIFNFGDNYAMHVAEGRVFGGYNRIQYAKKFFISGDQNAVAGNDQSTNISNGGNAFTTIFGSDNSVTYTPEADYISSNDRNTIFGCRNGIRGSRVADNSIFGSANQIGSFDTDYNITECFVSGSDNLISSRVNAFTILGKSNSVHCDGGPSDDKSWAIGNGFVQGNDNRVYFGSNAIAMGNGNIVEGHNAVAIGCQLKSNQWQTVIGKYNQPVGGPDRLTSADDPSQSNKALFIVGNGYSTKDDRDWKDEQFITRSNAMVVYANGDTVFSGNVNSANVPPAPSNDGRYALNCIVTNGIPSYSWIPVGTVTV